MRKLIFYFLGYSGEDCPRSMIPSMLGVLEGDAAKMTGINGGRVMATEDAEMIDTAA